MLLKSDERANANLSGKRFCIGMVFGVDGTRCGVPFVFNTELMEPNGQRSLVNSYASPVAA